MSKTVTLGRGGSQEVKTYLCACMESHLCAYLKVLSCVYSNVQYLLCTVLLGEWYKCTCMERRTFTAADVSTQLSHDM